PSVDNGYRSPVLSIGFLGRTDHSRALLAIADGRNPSRRNSRRDEHVLGRLGAAFAEREIVFASTPLIAVAFDRDRDVRVAPKPIGLSGQELTGFGADVRWGEGGACAVGIAPLQMLVWCLHDV